MSLSSTRYDFTFAYNALNGQQPDANAAQQQEPVNASSDENAGTTNGSTDSATEGETVAASSAGTDSTTGVNGTDTPGTNNEPIKLPVLPSRDEALKDLPSKDSATDSYRFIGNFQAYKLQQAIPKPPSSPTPPTPKPAASPTAQSAQQKQPAVTTGSTAEPQQPVNPKAPQNYVSQAEAKVFIDNFNGDYKALGKELSFKLMSQKPAEKDLVRAALAYVSSTSSPQIASGVAKQLINGIPGDGLLKSIAQSPEGARSLNLTRSYLSLDSSNNSGEIARLNKALTPTKTDSNLATGNPKDPNAILFGYQPKGASATTASQDKLSPGVESSKKMAAADRNSILAYKQQIIDVSKKYNFPPALIAGIASRESRGGRLLDSKGYGDRGNGFGLLQVDVQNNPVGGPFSAEHLEQAVKILSNNRDALIKKFPNWSEVDILRGAVAAYNFGTKNVRSNGDSLDIGTTGGDYSNDVLARAQFYATDFGSTNTAINTSVSAKPISNTNVAAVSNPGPNKAVDTYLPVSEKYNRYGSESRKYGTSTAVNTLKDIAETFAKTHNTKISIGDISQKGGGKIGRHESHQQGIDVDILLVRKDGKFANTNVDTPSTYDHEATRELVLLIKEKYPKAVILLNDQKLIDEGLTKYWKGHDDHLHVKFKP